MRLFLQAPNGVFNGSGHGLHGVAVSALSERLSVDGLAEIYVYTLERAVGAVNKAGDDGAVRAHGDHGNAGEHGHAFVGFAAGTLGEDAHAIAVLKCLQRSADGGKVGSAAVYLDGLQAGEEPVGELLFEQLLLGQEADLAPDGQVGTEVNRVNGVYVVGADDEAAFLRDIFLAVSPVRESDGEGRLAQ